MVIKTYTESELKDFKGETDWERVRNMKDEEIDISDIPMLTDEMLATAKRFSYGKLVDEMSETEVNIKIKNDILTFFKSMGDDWQERINEALAQVVKLKKVLS